MDGGPHYETRLSFGTAALAKCERGAGHRSVQSHPPAGVSAANVKAEILCLN